MSDGLLATPPATELASAAHRLLLTDCDAHLVAHCERSFQFAAAITREEGIEVDAEMLYVGVMLHDLGLSPARRGPARFEMRGANAVRTWLLDAGVERARAELAWDVVALHASGAIAAHKGPETDVANRGISVDVRGVAPRGVAPEVVRAILDAYPRHGFADAMTASLIAEVRAAPKSVRLSWLESIAVRHVDGFVASDFEAVLAASAGFV